MAMRSQGNREQSWNGVEVRMLRIGREDCRRPERSGDGRDKNYRLVLEILAWKKELVDCLWVVVSFKGL